MADKYEIAVLAEDYELKRQVWEYHCVLNTPTDPEERIKASIAYHQAEAEMMQARVRLERAKVPT